MKKLMIVLAAVVTGVAANAASVNWQTGTVTKQGLPTSVTSMSGIAFQFYEITATEFSTTWGDDMAKVLAAYQGKTGSFKDATSIATATTKPNGTASTTSATGADSWSAGSNHYLAMIGTKTVGDDTYYYVSTFDGTVGTGDNTSSATSLGSTIHGGSSASNSWQTVPEPTSGLLLLLGVAGLALRRRRA